MAYAVDICVKETGCHDDDVVILQRLAQLLESMGPRAREATGDRDLI